MKIPPYYVLNEQGEPQPESDLLKWGIWMEITQGKRHVADEMVGPNRISTVFLGLDHGFGREGPPILWETMTFGPGPDICERCSGSREQAEAMHARIVQQLKNTPISSIAPPNKDAL